MKTSRMDNHMMKDLREKGGSIMSAIFDGVRRMRGFTLIEIIVSLLLVAILAATGGMAIVQATQGYLTVRDNATTTQKAELAMSRITREIVEMTGITANATSTVLPVKNVDRNLTVGVDSGAIKVATSGALSGGDILVDSVSSFTLTYYSKDSSGNAVTSSSWPTTSDIRELAAIDINLQITRPDGTVLAFLNRVSPRNNKNQGGAAPNVAPPTLPQYRSCFVATAVFGDSAHPMVMLLREFRDRFLLTWGGGKWLVDQYYVHGPAAASWIKDKHVVIWAVRVILMPIAALTFFIVYAPWAIPFLLLSSLIVTIALFAAGRKRKEPMRSLMARQKGSVLLGLIAAMVVMATLGAAMVPMFSASYMNQAGADQGRKAYFLAESGFRFVSSQYLNANSDAGKNAVLSDVNNKICRLANNGGSFRTVVYPFWSVLQGVSGTTLTTLVYGTVPTEWSAGAGYIKIKNSYYSYASRTVSGSTVAYTGVAGLNSALLPSNPGAGEVIDVLPMAVPANTTLSENGNLTLTGGFASFPLRNGNFKTSETGDTIFNYETRNNGVLQKITLADPTKTWGDVYPAGVSISTSTRIVLDKYLKLSSTGNYAGNTREIVYNVPLGWLFGGGAFEKKHFEDRFNSGANWFLASNQTLGTQSVSGGSMNVTNTVDPTGASGFVSFLRGILGWGGNGRWAFTAFNWGSTSTNLAQAWMDSQGCLSYDIQVKVNHSNTSQPNNYYMGGLGFRLRSTNDDLFTYGVSIVRGRQRYSYLLDEWYNDWLGTDQDQIANELASRLFVGSMEETGNILSGRYRYSQPAIVFWQRNGNATGTGTFKVLAYRLLTANDAIMTGTAPALRLKPWTSLMVRVIEGYALTFTAGRNDTLGRHLKYGDKIQNTAGTKTARVIGTPMVSSGSFSANNASGTMILNMMNGGAFSSGEAIKIVGGDGTTVAQAGTYDLTKANYIMVYYSDNKTEVAGNTIQRDNTRIGNVRDGVNFLEGIVWPPDDRTDLTAGRPADNPASNDWFSLVGGPASSPMRWTELITTGDGYGHSASFVPIVDTSSDFHNAVIRTNALVTAAWTDTSSTSDFAGDMISLITSGSSVSDSQPFQYDDFSIQLDIKSGTGFLPPIQQ